MTSLTKALSDWWYRRPSEMSSTTADDERGHDWRSMSKNGMGGLSFPVDYNRAASAQSLSNVVEAMTGSGSGSGGNSIIRPKDPVMDWRSQGLDEQPLDKYSTNKLLDALCDTSPEVSRALWDFLRFCNPGWTVKCFNLGAETENPRAAEAIGIFIDHLDDVYGSIDIVFSRLNFSAFLRGGYFAELIFDASGRIPLDIVTPDPEIVRFQVAKSPERGGTYHQLGYEQQGKFISLDRPTVRYIPVDPAPGNPFGRSLITPALFATLFLMGMLNDVRRVVAQQGYPRIDLEIDMEQLAVSLPDEVKNDPESFMQWVTAAYADVRKIYAALQPDDAYIHTSIVKVNQPKGTVDANSLAAVDNIMQFLERFIMRAVKSNPLLMGLTENMSEANANRQWEIHVAGIKALQHLHEKLLQRLFTLVLQAQGIQARVEFRFAELRTAELLRDNMAHQLLIANTSAEYAMGWISQDEASFKVVGHKPFLPEPLALPKNLVPAGPGNDVAAAGANEDAAGTATTNAEDKGATGNNQLQILYERQRSNGHARVTI